MDCGSLRGWKFAVVGLGGGALAFAMSVGCARAGAVAVGAVAAPPVPTVGDQGPSGLVLPKLAGAKAPAWTRVGLRLTYKVATATIAGTGADWKEDPDGAWKTEDGKRWSPTERGSNAAGGYLQFDVTAMPDGAAAVNATFYLASNLGDAPKASFSYPIVGQAANAGGLWVNPDELRKAKNLVSTGLKVQRMPYEIGAKSRPAVWIQSLGDRGNLFYVYDEESGVLLHDATAIEGKPSPVVGKDEVSNTPSTTLSQGTLVAQRMVVYPWAGADARPWSASPRKLVYKGTTLVPVSGGSPLVLGQEVVATPQGNGDGWVRYSTIMTTTNPMGAPPQTFPGETISGLGQFGGAWLPPSRLAKLTQGQVLDKDPITLVNVAVSSVSSSQVVISATSPAETLRWGYDRRSGLLSLIEKEDHNVYAPIKTRLVLQNG